MGRALLNSKEYSGKKFQSRWPIVYDELYANSRHSIYFELNPHQYPIPGVWLAHIRYLWDLEGCTHWLVKDGALGLIWFFYKFPNPPSKKIFLYIEKNLSCFVPESWRSKVGVYSLFTLPTDKPKKKNCYLMVGAWLSPYTNSKDLISLIRSTSKKTEDVIYDFYLFPSSTNNSVDDLISLISLGKSLQGSLRGKLFFHNPKKFEMNNQICGQLIWRGSPLIVSDSLLVHKAIGKGAEFHAPLQHKKYFFISPRHGYQLYDKVTCSLKNACETQKKLFEGERYYTNILGHNRHDCFPWPKWFDALALDFFKK